MCRPISETFVLYNLSLFSNKLECLLSLKMQAILGSYPYGVALDGAAFKYANMRLGGKCLIVVCRLHKIKIFPKIFDFIESGRSQITIQ